MSSLRFKLSWVEYGGYCSTRYGYGSAHAACVAAPVVNRARRQRGLPDVTHVSAFEADRCVAVYTFDEIQTAGAASAAAAIQPDANAC